MRVPFLALLSGLRIWCCHGCGIGQQLQLQLDPSLGTSICCWCGPKKKKKIHSFFGVPVVVQRAMNLTSICGDSSSIPGCAQWVKDLALL